MFRKQFHLTQCTTGDTFNRAIESTLLVRYLLHPPFGVLPPASGGIFFAPGKTPHAHL